MKIFVKVTPRAKSEKLEKVSGNTFRIWVKEPPVEGKANDAVVKVLAEHFRVSRREVRIVSGRTSRSKVVEI